MADAAGMTPQHPPSAHRNSLLFVSLMASEPWGGSEELWFRSALRAAARGHEVGCVVYDWPEKRERLARLEAAGATVTRLSNRGRNKRTRLERLEYELVTRLRQHVQVPRLPFARYDRVVLNQGGNDEIAAPEWSRLAARIERYALTFHSYTEDMILRSRRIPRLRRWVSGAAANLFASDRIRVVLEDRLGCAIPNAAVLTNPITFDPPSSPVAPPPEGPVRLAMLSALNVRWKAQDHVIRALSTPTWRARDWVLELWGAGRDETLLRDLAAASGLAGRVLLRGHTTDPASALANAHLVLQPSRQDACPTSVMEAMAVGRPLLVSRVGDMPVWVRDGENGWVCPDSSVESITAALDAAWRDRERWIAMGIESHRRFRARYPASVEDRFLEQVGADGGAGV